MPSGLLFLLGVVACGFAVWSEGSVSGQDEYWLTFRTPMEMLDRGDWWTPWLNGEPRLQKPPLIYWLICASYEALGRNLLAARIWSVLCGAGMALVAARLHRRLFGTDGTLAGLIVLSSIGVAIESRRAMLDLPMGFFVTLAVYLGVGWVQHPRLRHALFAGAALAASALTKGPVALLFAGTAVLAAGIAGRGHQGTATRRPRVHVVLATLLLVALVLPWPISMIELWPQLEAVLAEQSEARQFRFAPHESIGPVVGGGLGLVLPWSIAVLCALFARRGTASPRAVRWLVLWIAISALPFLFMKSFERYLIPLAVPAAVLAAHYLDAATRRARRIHGTIAVALLGIPVVLFCGFTLWFGLAVLAPVATLTVWGVALRDVRRAASPRRTALGCTILVALLLGGVYPAIGINVLPDDLPADLAQSDVAVYRISQPGMLSMRAGRSVLAIRDGEALGERLRDFDGYVFVADDRIDDFVADAAGAGLHLELRTTLRSFFSRKAWLRFAKEGAGWTEWRAALASRSIEDLKPGFVCFRARWE